MNEEKEVEEKETEDSKDVVDIWSLSEGQRFHFSSPDERILKVVEKDPDGLGDKVKAEVVGMDKFVYYPPDTKVIKADG